MSSRPDVPLERYKYKISDIILTADGFEEPILIRNKFIRSLSIMNNYESTISPKIQLMFDIEKEYYREIILNMNTMVATFTIYKIFIGELTDSLDVNKTEEIEQDHIWRTMTLKAINDDNVNIGNINKLDSDIDLETMDNAQQTVSLTLLLYDNDKITKYRKNEFYILKGNKNDLLYNYFKDRNFNNILMTPTDSSNDTYIIPYGHLGNNIRSLNSYYGIYDNPYLFFMDLDCTYLLDKGNIGNTLREGELKTVSIYLEKETNSRYITGGSYADIDNNMYILNTVNFDVINNDSTIDYVIGGDIKTVIGGTGEIKNDKIGDYNVERSVVVDNPKLHSQLIYNIKEQKRGISLQFSNIDLSIITPNKRYTLLPDESFFDNKYNIKGDYRLSQIMLLFKRTNEDELNSSMSIMLNKILI